MFSKNFYYRLKYQLDKKAIYEVLYQYFLDRFKHPFHKTKKIKIVNVNNTQIFFKKLIN